MLLKLTQNCKFCVYIEDFYFENPYNFGLNYNFETWRENLNVPKNIETWNVDFE